jgi:hypothetical protein
VKIAYYFLRFVDALAQYGPSDPITLEASGEYELAKGLYWHENAT